MKLLDIIKAFLHQRAFEYIDSEIREKERLFSFLLFGYFAGFPLGSPLLTLKYLPYSEKELKIFMEVLRDMEDLKGKVFGRLDID